MSVIMRNRVTTEYRRVEADSEEFYALRAELDPSDNRPRWEQTGEHDLAAFQSRQDAGVTRNSDLGDAEGPANINTLAPDDLAVGLDRGYPTPGEIEQDAGRARFVNEDGSLKSDADITAVPASEIEGPNEGYPAGAPPAVVPDGSDAGTSVASVSDSSAGTSYNNLSVPQLRDRASARGVEVTRADGGDGDPLKSDYIAALEDADSRGGATPA
jgi:hypothetical protein